jgi:Arc/MetJ family transcription regulator
VIFMSKTSLEIDRDIAERAMMILGVTTMRETVDLALRKVVERDAWHRLADHLADNDAIDWAATDEAWGGGE